MTARRDLWIALGIGGCAFAAYVATLPPSYGVWDVAELQTVAAILGIAHPPGCPVFVLLGYTFVHLVPFGDPAWRVNLMGALAVSTSAAIAFAVARRLDVGAAPALVCALGFAFAQVPWVYATHAEIQSVALCFRVLALFLGLRWVERGERRDLLLAALATGLGLATHGTTLLVLPALAMLLAARPEGRRPRTLALVAATIAAGMLPYAYVPLRSAFVDAHALEPTVALGLPAGLPFWNYDDPSTPARFGHFVTGADFHVAGGFAGFVDVLRYPDYIAALAGQTEHAYGFLGALLALGGACVLIGSRRLDRAAFVVAALLPVPYTLAYSDLQEPDRYYLLTLWCAALAIGVAFEAIGRLVPELQARGFARYGAALVLGMAFATAPGDRAAIPAQRHERFGPDFAAEVRTFTPDDAILLVAWGYATPLAYASYVEGSFGHRTVVPAGPTQYLTYVPRWLERRTVYVIGFDSDLKIRGWRVVPVKRSTYYAYRLTK